MRLCIVLALIPVSVLGAYDETKAIEYANFAGASYCDSEVLAKWDCGVKCISTVTDVKVCEGDSTKAFVGKYNGKCIAAFEGTANLVAVKVDLQSFKVPWRCSGCWVHSGFLGEWTSLESCMKESLQDIGCGPDEPLHGTGHSLGAAVAAVAMFSLHEDGWNIAELYNFGMPRMANLALATRFDETFKGRFFRVTHGKDPFIDMPLGPFYVHVEPEVFYKGSVQKGYVICHSPFDERCAAQYFPDAQNVMNSQDVAYHHDYMGVQTTQAQCRAGEQACDADIAGSWCSYGIPCNADARGKEVWCHHGSAFRMGYGKCHCNPGYCPVDGKCTAQASEDVTMVDIMAMAREAPGGYPASGDSLSPSVPVWLAGVGITVGLLSGFMSGLCFASRWMKKKREASGGAENLRENLIMA